ncbi:DUF2155 domain-containing protein [Oryzomonas japonica]|uniref:DUF2155 domain-containing protein n=1 Tax=Oryzomonas japonica TaxID=2603858 RepID=A0A7J4ZVR6_9BACT|nr:DUF2155 domain-containing protein [Oryzomonas japonica]
MGVFLTIVARVQKVLIIVLLFLPAFLLGCQPKGQEQKPQPKIDAAGSHVTKKEATVVVPDAVKKSWKAVRIAVIDKANIKETVYTIPIGSSVSIPAFSLDIAVEAFLPAFIMEGAVMTTSSNDLKNPGAKVTITEKGNIIFKGWLFARFPTNTFMHPNYGFTLVDAVPAK